MEFWSDLSRMCMGKGRYFIRRYDDGRRVNMEGRGENGRRGLALCLSLLFLLVGLCRGVKSSRRNIRCRVAQRSAMFEAKMDGRHGKEEGGGWKGLLGRGF